MCPVVILASPSILNNAKLTLKMRSRVRAEREVVAGNDGELTPPSGDSASLVSSFGLATELDLGNFGNSGRIEIIEQMLPRENLPLAVF